MKLEKTPIWFDLTYLQILNRVNEGIGLTDNETREETLTKAFNKLHKHGYIKGIYYIGFKTELKDGSQLTEKGINLLAKFKRGA